MVLSFEMKEELLQPTPTKTALLEPQGSSSSNVEITDGNWLAIKEKMEGDHAQLKRDLDEIRGITHYVDQIIQSSQTHDTHDNADEEEDEERNESNCIRQHNDVLDLGISRSNSTTLRDGMTQQQQQQRRGLLFEGKEFFVQHKGSNNILQNSIITSNNSKDAQSQQSRLTTTTEVVETPEVQTKHVVSSDSVPWIVPKLSCSASLSAAAITNQKRDAKGATNLYQTMLQCQVPGSLYRDDVVEANEEDEEDLYWRSIGKYDDSPGSDLSAIVVAESESYSSAGDSSIESAVTQGEGHGQSQPPSISLPTTICEIPSDEAESKSTRIIHEESVEVVISVVQQKQQQSVLEKKKSRQANATTTMTNRDHQIMSISKSTTTSSIRMSTRGSSSSSSSSKALVEPTTKQKQLKDLSIRLDQEVYQNSIQRSLALEDELNNARDSIQWMSVRVKALEGLNQTHAKEIQRQQQQHDAYVSGFKEQLQHSVTREIVVSKLLSEARDETARIQEQMEQNVHEKLQLEEMIREQQERTNAERKQWHEKQTCLEKSGAWLRRELYETQCIWTRRLQPAITALGMQVGVQQDETMTATTTTSVRGGEGTAAKNSVALPKNNVSNHNNNNNDSDRMVQFAMIVLETTLERLSVMADEQAQIENENNRLETARDDLVHANETLQAALEKLGENQVLLKKKLDHSHDQVNLAGLLVVLLLLILVISK
jgi:hypothetical protein